MTCSPKTATYVCVVGKRAEKPGKRLKRGQDHVTFDGAHGLFYASAQRLGHFR
jgi:hypothetical protein